MSEPIHSDGAYSLLPQPPGYGQQIAALREFGAQQEDPLGLHYLEVLSARAQAQSGLVKNILEDKLARAVADFKLRLEQAQGQVQGQPSSHAGDGVAQAEACVPPRESLGDLVRSMAHAPDMGAAGSPETVAAGPELKSVRMFRNTWSKLSAGKQLNKALDQAPKNAGPINSHMLVLRSLALMREIAPDYLNRFISYADTLLCLEQSEKARYAAAKPAAKPAADSSGARPAKARKPRAR